ncbi:MAG: hypothetical protein R3B70_47630 [Polyangiaceae bacterium]
MRRAWVLALTGVLVAVVPIASSVKAQPAAQPSASERALALGREALDLYNKASWAEARAKFEEADRLAHSPAFVLYAARCARNSGDLKAAKAAYEKLAQETLPANAPPPWLAAIESAKEELPEVNRRLAEQAAAAGTAAPSTTAAPSSTTVPSSTTAPSTTTAPSSSAVPSSTTVPSSTATPPATGAQASTTSPSGTAGPVATGVARLPPFGEGDGGNAAGPLLPGIAAMGLGAVAAGVGIGLFVDAKSKADDVLSRCPGETQCQRADQGTAQSAIDMANGATAAFAIAGAALGAGVVLLIVQPGKKAQAGKGSMSVRAGAGSLMVTGAF